VISDAEAWSKAKEGGDVVYVDHLLLPEYRSVNSDGSAHGKDALLVVCGSSPPPRIVQRDWQKWQNRVATIHTLRPRSLPEMWQSSPTLRIPLTHRSLYRRVTFLSIEKGIGELSIRSIRTQESKGLAGSE
jgi:hypothetical protein